MIARTPILLSLALACAALSARTEPAVFDERVVFTSGTEGYHTFRIPAIICAANGDLLAFAEGRVNNARDHDDVDLVLKRSRDNGATWSPVQVLAGAQDRGVITWGNPCPVVDRSNGRIWLPLCWENYKLYVMHSDDHGRTWSEPRDITAQAWNLDWPRSPEPTLAAWTGPGVGIQIELGPHAGRLVIPMHLRRHPLTESGKNEVAVFYSDDHGATWHHSRNTTGVGNEPQVVELADGRLMLNQRHQIARGQRDGTPRHRWISYSGDGGATWSRSVADDELIDPTVQASLIRYRWPGEEPRDAQGLLLFANPATVDQRSRMTVRASFDDGATWPVQRLVREDFAAYSSLVRQADGMVGLLYETDRYKHIRYARFNLAWLGAGAFPLQTVDFSNDTTRHMIVAQGTEDVYPGSCSASCARTDRLVKAAGKLTAN